MALVDIGIREETMTDKADKIREKLSQVVDLAEMRLHEIRNLFRTYGRAELAAQFGDDASALLTVYTKLKEAIEAAKNTTVEELP